MIDFSRNHFELLGLPARFRIDSPALDVAYRSLQAQVHPDLFARGSDAERRMALQASARVNEAYGALKAPVARAQYLLGLHAVDATDEKDTRLDLEFLERQLERREAAEEAKAGSDLRTLESLHDAVVEESRELEQALAHDLDREGADYAAAKPRVRELAFLVKLADDLDAMIASLD